jgi:hypothetical protein
MDGQLRLMDLAGRTVLGPLRANAGVKAMNVDLPNGSYLLVLQHAGGRTVLPVLIDR